MRARDLPPVAITGASGFIGRGVVQAFSKAGLSTRAISRQPAPAGLPELVTWYTVQGYGNVAILGEALSGADCVIHLADDSDRQRRGVSTGSIELALALISGMERAGTRRLVLVSSIYARLAREEGSYGKRKRRIEDKVLQSGGVQTVVLRLPPVYGPGGRGGFATLSRLIDKKLPLPLGRADEPRAYLSLRNLSDLMICIAGSDDERWAAAAGRRFEPSDGRPIGTADLVRSIAGETGRLPVRLWPVPLPLLRLFGQLTGYGEMVSGAVDGLETEGNDPLTAAFAWTPCEQIPESLSFLRRT